MDNQRQAEYKRLKEKYNNDKFSIHLLEKFMQKDNPDWKKVEEVLKMFS